MSGGQKAGIGGIGAIIIAALLAYLSGGNPLEAGLQVAQQQMSAPTETIEGESFTEEEQALASDCKKILASTEDMWQQVFQQNGWGNYTPPTLVLFSNQVNSACGAASAAVGPFYCSGDQKLYVDLSFFTQMNGAVYSSRPIPQLTQALLKLSLARPLSASVFDSVPVSSLPIHSFLSSS